MRKLGHLTWALLAASLVVGLAGAVRIANPTVGADDLPSVIRLQWVVTATIAALFGVAALVLLLGLVRRARSRRHEDDDVFVSGSEPPRRQPWLQALAQLLSLVNFLVIAYLLWKNVPPLQALMALGHGAGAAGAVPQDAVPSAPVLITWTFALLALLAGCGALAFALWFTSGDRVARWWERDDDDPAPPLLTDAVEESLEDLRAEPDARRAIIRCYARFERAAAASGVARKPWHTPMEFMRDVLSRLPAPGAVRALTGLFELARFSDRALGLGERDRALDALDDIKAVIGVVR